MVPCCWYCDATFPEEWMLIIHQRKTHFTCRYCEKESDHAPQLRTHCKKIHKITENKLPNATTNQTTSYCIRGMEGIPRKPSSVERKQCREFIKFISASADCYSDTKAPSTPGYKALIHAIDLCKTKMTPWCWYYCHEEFSSEVKLLKHQQNIHFSCPRCRKQFDTGHHLILHIRSTRCRHVVVSEIPNTLSKGKRLNESVCGMQGIPLMDLILHYMKYSV